MTNHKNLKNRVSKARAAATFARETSEGVWTVPGSENPYTVTVTRNGELAFECRDSAGHLCKGNSSHLDVICYHSMAVAVRLAEAQGKRIAWCARASHAYRLSRMGGRVYWLTGSLGQQYIVMYLPEEEKNLKTLKTLTDEVDVEFIEAQLENLAPAIKDQEDWLERNSWSIKGQDMLNRLASSRDELKRELAAERLRRGVELLRGTGENEL